MRLRRSTRTTVEALETRTLMAATDLDPGFSSDGVVTLNFSGGFDNANAVAVQKDGKVIIAGEAGSLGIAVARYNADGSLDDGGAGDSTPGDHFGTGGKLTKVIGTQAQVNAIAIQKDGKILLAGTAVSSGETPQQYWLLVRLNANGTLDSTFNSGGISGLQSSIYNTPLTGVALQNDGKIVVCGTLNNDFLVGRFTSKGELDNTFDGGTVTTDFGGVDKAAGVVIDNLGNIVVAGAVGGDGLIQRAGVARYRADGSLDSNFSSDGKALRSIKDRVDVNGVTITGDGRIWLAAAEYSASFGGLWIPSLFSFGPDGTEGLSYGGNDSKAVAITVMPNGKFVAAETYVETGSQLQVVPQDGIETHPFVGLFTGTGATAIAAAPDGGIYEAGFADRAGGRDFLLVKFQGIDPTTWGAVNGNVFRDSDGDRVQDPNEKGIANVKVYIDVNNNGRWDRGRHVDQDEPYVYTDVNGNFSIRNIAPGSFTVDEVAPGGSTQDLPAVGSYKVTVSGGKSVKGLIFANNPVPAASTRTAINGSVFNDWNGNGKRDISKPTEPDLAGIVVFIDANKNGLLDKKETQTKTDAGGNYSLNLSRGGTYRVAAVLRKGWINTTPAFFDVKVGTHAQATERFGQSLVDANDTISEVKTAAAIALGKTVAGSLGSAVDVNIYRIVVAAKKTVGFDIDAASGSSLNSYLRLFDAKGHQLAFNNDAAAPGEGASVDSYLRYRFITAGTYYIAVSDHLNTAFSAASGKGDIGTGTKGKYSLSINLV